MQAASLAATLFLIVVLRVVADSLSAMEPAIAILLGNPNARAVISSFNLESSIRELIQFLDMFIKLYIVGIMLLYVLRAKLPLSYRCWSGLCGLSLLVYN